jgi:hypothetical protein
MRMLIFWIVFRNSNGSSERALSSRLQSRPEFDSYEPIVIG